MTINKNTDLEFSLQQNTEKGGVYTNFYTEDKGSASIRIRLSNQGYYLDLTKTDLKPVLFLFHDDGSIFEIKDFMNVMPEQGLIQYNFSDNVIRHAGKVKAKVFLKNETKSVHVANFSFDIKDSGIEGAVEKEINVNIIDDAVKKIINEQPELFKGEKGDIGPQGIQGERGPQGIPGERGNSAYEIAVKYGFSGTEAEWVESMKTADGELVPENLVTKIVSNKTLSSTTGSENPSSNYSSVDFIEINPSKIYTYGYSNLDSDTAATTRIVFYDDSKKMISMLEWRNIYKDDISNITPPAGASYIRFIIPNNLTNSFYFNEGKIPYFVIEKKLEEETEEENKKIVNKVIESLDLDKLKEEKKPLKPYPNRLMWKALLENTNIKPLTMNREGTVIYASDGLRIRQSTDEGKTWTYIGGIISDQMVQGIRVLDDGELIVTTSRDKNNGIKSKLYKSSNYSVENPENTTYTEKLEMHNLDAAFNNAWCLDNYYNIVLASDYGGHYLTGARYVYLSTDYGETWETIFDQKEASETVDGAPSYTTDAHVHTCHYDRYRERIWVCVGDQDNTATYYSDDMGETWEIIKGYTGKNTMQYTGITSYPEGVFFGSDRSPDGIYFWDEDKPNEINPYYLTERSDIRTIVYALPFRRFAEKDEVCYFVGNRDGVVDGTMSPVIVGFKGVHGAQLLYDFTDDINNFKYSDISACVGNTVNNNVLVSVKDDNTKRYRLLIAKAPVWE